MPDPITDEYKKIQEEARASMLQKHAKQREQENMEQQERLAQLGQPDRSKFEQKFQEQTQRLDNAGLEAYMEWITGMMQIVSASGALHKILVNDFQVTERLKQLVTNVIDKAKDFFNKSMPVPVLEAFDKDNNIMVPKLHFRDPKTNENIPLNDSTQQFVNRTVENSFNQWLQENGFAYDAEQKSISKDGVAVSKEEYKDIVQDTFIDAIQKNLGILEKDAVKLYQESKQELSPENNTNVAP